MAAFNSQALSGRIDMTNGAQPLHAGQADKDAEIEVLQREIRDLRGRIDTVETARRELLSSTSWRITKPIRALKTRLTTGTERGADVLESTAAPAVPGQISRVSRAPGSASGNETCSRVDVKSAFRPLSTLPAPVQGATRIAFVGSQELADELMFDARLDILLQSNWRDFLTAARFDYLLVETIWTGARDEWRYAMTSEGDSRAELSALLEECRRISLPIVLWFREDVRNFERFSWIVARADRIYAIDDEIGARIRREHRGVEVSILPPAIQPAVHNPMCSYALQESRNFFRGSALFDGWWDTAADGGLRNLLESLVERGVRLCESEWEFGSVRLQDMPALAPITLGCVSVLEKAVLNKLIPTELFFHNTLRLPWRQRLSMIRAAAAGSSIGFIDGPDPGGVTWHGKADQVGAWLSQVRSNPIARAATSHKMRRRILAQDCLTHRLARIGSDLGLAPQPFETLPEVAMVLVTMRPELLQACLQRFRRDTYANKELIVVLHGEHELSSARALVLPGERIRIMQVGRERSLGACLNQAIDESGAEYWAKIDDDDLYGPEYLSDVMASRLFSDFHIAGKPPVFAYLEAEDSLYHDPEWASLSQVWHAPGEASAALVAGGTLVGRRDLLDRGLRFSEKRRGGSDSDFIRQCYEHGHGLLALDGFNFVRYRSGKAGFHTWQMDERELQSRATLIGGLDSVAAEVFV